MASISFRSILALLVVYGTGISVVADAGAASGASAAPTTAAGDAATAAAGMALELDRTADADRWLRAVPEGERGWAWRLVSSRADNSLGIVADLHTPLVAAALSADGSRFAVAAALGEMRVYRTSDLQEVAKLDTEGISTRDIALSPKGDHLLASGGDGRLRIWDVERRHLLLLIPGSSDELGSVAWSPDGQTFAAGGYVRDTATGRPKGIVTLYTPLGLEVRSFEPKALFVSALRFSPTAKILAAGGPQGQLSLFDPAGGDAPRHLRVAANDSSPAGAQGASPQIDGLAFSSDGTRLAAACGDGSVRLWESASGNTLALLSRGPDGHRAGVSAVSFARNGTGLATAGSDLTLRLWDPSRDEPLAILHGHVGTIVGLLTLPNGELVTASEDGTVRRWSAAPTELVLDHAGATVWDASLDASGDRMATAAKDGKLRIWDLASRKVTREIAAHTSDAIQAIFSADGVRLVSSGNDGTLRVWNAGTGERIAELAHLDHGRFSRLARSPDGTLLAAGTSVGTVQIRSLPSGELLRVLTAHTGEVGAISFSADGARVVTAAADGNVIVWETATGKQVKWIHAHEAEIHGAALSPDGRRLATASNDRTVRVWDVASGGRLSELRGHTERVRDVVWSPDGRLLASASNDFTARVWNADSGAPLAVLRYPMPVQLALWSQDGETLFVAPFDGAVRIYRPAR